MYVFNLKKGKETHDLNSENFLKINSLGVAVGS